MMIKGRNFKIRSEGLVAHMGEASEEIQERGTWCTKEQKMGTKVTSLSSPSNFLSASHHFHPNAGWVGIPVLFCLPVLVLSQQRPPLLGGQLPYACTIETLASCLQFRLANRRYWQELKGQKKGAKPFLPCSLFASVLRVWRGSLHDNNVCQVLGPMGSSNRRWWHRV